MADPPEFGQFSDWDLLLRHLRFSEGFSLSFLTVPDRIAERECIERLSEWANGQTRPLVLRRFATAGELTSLASWLVELESCEPASIIAGAASVPLGLIEGPDWKVAWTQGLSWLNQYRNLVQQRHPCALLLIGPEYLLSVAREAAPDLWSVRAVCASMTPAPSDSAGQSRDRAEFERYEGLAIDPEFAMREARRLLGRPEAQLHAAFFLLRAALGFAARGRTNEAITPIEEAVAIYRHHATDGQADHRVLLANALNNLSNHLSHLGRRKEAYEAAREAVETLRAEAGNHPEEFRPELASALNTLSICLSELGRREEAYEAIREAVEIRRALTEERPEAFRPSLAISLSNMAGRLGELRRWEEAYGACSEAVAIHRALAAESPDSFLPPLAVSLSHLSNILNALGRVEEAFESGREAVSICRALTADHPEAFRPDLASFLSNLSGVLRRLDRTEEAHEAVREAAEIHRALVEEHPDEFRSDLAFSLTNLSGSLIELGRLEEADKAVREAVDIRRALAAEHPEAIRPRLATSLGALNRVLDSMSRHQEAAEACREALEVLWPSFELIPAAHGPLAFSLLKDYLSQCKKAEAHPDVALVERYMNILESMKAEGGTAEESR